MDAVAEGDMAAGVAGEVEVGAGREEPLVAVGGGQHADHALARRDRHLAHPHGLGGRPAETEVDDREVAQQFFYGTAHQLRLRAQEFRLAGATQQGEHADGRHVRGGLVPGDQEQKAERGRLLVGQVLAGGEPAEDVVSGLPTLALRQLRQIARELSVGPLRLRAGGAVVEESPAERLEQVVVLVRHPQHQADDQRRDRQREVRHQVGRGATLGHAVHGPVDDVLDARAQFLDPLDQEVLGDHPAQPGVLGVVHADETRLGGGQFTLPGGQEREPRCARVGAEPGVGQHGPYLVVPGDQPARGAVRQRGTGDGGLAGGGGVGGRRGEGATAVGRREVEGGDGERRGGHGWAVSSWSTSVMAPLGHRSAAKRTSSAYRASGSGTSSATRPSDSSCSNTSGATPTH